MVLYKSKHFTSKIKIQFFPIEIERAVVWALKNGNKSLKEAIIAHRDMLQEQGQECFETYKNIIAMESGFYVSLWNKGFEYEVQEPVPTKGIAEPVKKI